MIRNQYSRSFVHYDRIVQQCKKSLDKSDTTWNIRLAPQSKSMKGVLILFVDPAANGGGANYARDSENFYNSKIEKVSVILEGNPNQLYSSGMLPHQNFEEIRKALCGWKTQGSTARDQRSQTLGCDHQRLPHLEVRAVVGLPKYRRLRTPRIRKETRRSQSKRANRNREDRRSGRKPRRLRVLHSRRSSRYRKWNDECRIKK